MESSKSAVKNVKITAMVAESESLLRKSICDVLVEPPFNYSVIEVKNGLEVIEKLGEYDVDILIINTLLPKVSGADIISLIRKAENKEREIQSSNSSFCDTNFDAPDIKYIYIVSMIESESSNSTDDTVSNVIKIGSDDFIFKPFSLELLKSKLKAANRIIRLQKEIKDIYKTIYMLSTTDTLCKVWNRRTIINKLYKQICIASREHKSLAVFMVDIDHFKKINDTYGHLFGDKVLTATAETLKQCCRIYDEVGRYGGEEFLIVTPLYSESFSEINYKEGNKEREFVARQIGERILKTVRKKVKIVDDKEVSVTISIGGAIIDFTLPKQQETDAGRLISCRHNGEVESVADILLKQADTAMYTAKETGRDRFVLYDYRKREK